MKKNNISWKVMSIGDKLLLIMENACYLFALGALIAIIFAMNKGLSISAGLLFLSAISLFACGRRARSTRDSYLKRWQLNFKTSSKQTSNFELKSTSKLYN